MLRPVSLLTFSGTIKSITTSKAVQHALAFHFPVGQSTPWIATKANLRDGLDLFVFFVQAFAVDALSHTNFTSACSSHSSISNVFGIELLCTDQRKLRWTQMDALIRASKVSPSRICFAPISQKAGKGPPPTWQNPPSYWGIFLFAASHASEITTVGCSPRSRLTFIFIPNCVQEPNTVALRWMITSVQTCLCHE